MLKLVKSPRIKLNLYFEDKIVFESIDFFQAIDIRRQILNLKLKPILSGYYFKIDSPYWYLYDRRAGISGIKCNVLSDGTMESWFPSYYLDDEYGYIDTNGEMLEGTIKLSQTMRFIENS